MTKLVWEDSELDEDDRWHAGRMMQIMVRGEGCGPYGWCRRCGSPLPRVSSDTLFSPHAPTRLQISYLHGSPHIGQYIEAMIGIAVTSLLHEAEKPFEHDYVRAEVFNIINMAMFYNPVQVWDGWR